MTKTKWNRGGRKRITQERKESRTNTKIERRAEKKEISDGRNKQIPEQLCDVTLNHAVLCQISTSSHKPACCSTLFWLTEYCSHHYKHFCELYFNTILHSTAVRPSAYLVRITAWLKSAGLVSAGPLPRPRQTAALQQATGLSQVCIKITRKGDRKIIITSRCVESWDRTLLPHLISYVSQFALINYAIFTSERKLAHSICCRNWRQPF